MKKIGLYVNTEKDRDLLYTKKISEILLQYGFEVVISDETASKLQESTRGIKGGDILSNSDLIISLGGDGTFLRVARMTFGMNIPLLGVNLGSLGFLTEVDKNHIQNVMQSLAKGDYEIEKRMMLEVQIERDGETIAVDTALNDIVISRGALSKIVYLKTYINNDFVEMYPGDGLIVSSPTGSTAYSLSAGGPIVEPDTELMIMTPICPHILYTRSFIIESSRIVKTVIDQRNQNEAMVTVDGQAGYEVKGGDVVFVKKSQTKFSLVKCNTPNFFSILRNKIYYRGEVLHKDEI
ncbi:MAG: NAD(+)/NADH kinase [Eubacteriales bacterium]|nr:NAD(+)/NADH kinase [Eubacteriales bacterium]